VFWGIWMTSNSETGNNKKKRLGQLLCEKSYLDETGLQAALAEQRVRHRQLGQILLDLGYITEAQLNEALALQVGIERVNLMDVSVSGDIIGLVPADLVSKHSILPLRRENGRLAVAMTDPFQPQALEELRFVTGCAIERYYADPTEMEHAIMRFYGSNVARMLDNLVPAEQRAADEAVENGDYSPARLHELAREPSLVNLVNLIILGRGPGGKDSLLEAAAGCDCFADQDNGRDEHRRAFRPTGWAHRVYGQEREG